MDRSTVQAWLDRYVGAWKSYDADAIAALFAPDATYRYHPYDPDDEAVRGARRDRRGTGSTNRDDAGDLRQPLRAVRGRGRPGRRGRLEPLLHGRVEGEARPRVYRNVYLLAFDGDGRCTSFTEFFMQTPGASRPADARLS